MYFTLGAEEQLNDLLNRIGSKLQLDNTRKERAKTSYETLCNWIKNDKAYFNNYEIDFYSQGSYRTGTTVKPLTGDEFDLDFVLEVKGNWKSENPLQILSHLTRRLKENNTYKNIVEVKTRCVRVNYANEFHIDVLPGFPEEKYSENDKIKVPDRDIKNWTDSNPKGYAKWFDDICKKYNTIRIEKRAIASVEPLPESPPYEFIEPLRRAVQLIKRFRDNYYKDKDISAPRSIVLTTLAADYYNGETSEYETILNILDGIHKSIVNSNGKPIQIYNPMNNKEKLSEKWDNDPILYKSFCEFINYFATQWSNLKSLESLEEKAVVLQDLFGETVSKDVIREQAEYINKFRSNNKLAINTTNGMLMGFTGVSNKSNNIKVVPKNTFYGE